MKLYYVYILTNHNRKLMYVGMTDDIYRRHEAHTSRIFNGFTAKYNIDRLVYYEGFIDAESALVREQEIKKWRREKKNRLVETVNPAWDSLILNCNSILDIPSALIYNAPLDSDPSHAFGIKCEA